MRGVDSRDEPRLSGRATSSGTASPNLHGEAAILWPPAVFGPQMRYSSLAKHDHCESRSSGGAEMAPISPSESKRQGTMRGTPCLEFENCYVAFDCRLGAAEVSKAR